MGVRGFAGCQGRWAAVLPAAALACALLPGPRDARADTWVAGRGGIAVELEHRLEVAVVEGMARATMRRVARNDGKAAADLVLAFRVPPGAVATGLAAPGGAGASLRWAGTDLLVLALSRVAPGTTRQADVTLWMPLRVAPREYLLDLPGPDAQPGMATRRVFVAGEREVPAPAGTRSVLAIPRKAPREARARHAFLPTARGGILAAELEAPRYFTTKPNPGKAIVLLDVAPPMRARGLALAGAFAGRFTRGVHQVLLPGDPPVALTDGFVDFATMLGALEARILGEDRAASGAPDGAERAGPAALARAALDRLGTERNAVRVALVTDRAAWDPALVDELGDSLRGLPPGSAVHAVLLAGGNAAISGTRDDAHPLSGLLGRHNGAAWRLDPGHVGGDDATDVMGNTVRPLWVDDVDLVLAARGSEAEGTGTGEETGTGAETGTGDADPGRHADPGAVPDRTVRAASRLDEGHALAVVLRAEAAPPAVAWGARMWAGRWQANSAAEAAMEQRVALRAVAAPWFADLDAADHDRVARVVGAVTPRWSWIVTPRGARHLPR